MEKSHQPPPKKIVRRKRPELPSSAPSRPQVGSAKQLGAVFTVRNLFFFLLLARCSYPAARKALNCWLRGAQKQPQAKVFGLPASISAQWEKRVVVALLAEAFSSFHAFESVATQLGRRARTLH